MTLHYKKVIISLSVYFTVKLSIIFLLVNHLILCYLSKYLPKIKLNWSGAFNQLPAALVDLLMSSAYDSKYVWGKKASAHSKSKKHISYSFYLIYMPTYCSKVSILRHIYLSIKVNTACSSIGQYVFMLYMYLHLL